jgi:hypothetical protein
LPDRLSDSETGKNIEFFPGIRQQMPGSIAVFIIDEE